MALCGPSFTPIRNLSSFLYFVLLVAFFSGCSAVRTGRDSDALSSRHTPMATERASSEEPTSPTPTANSTLPEHIHTEASIKAFNGDGTYAKKLIQPSNSLVVQKVRNLTGNAFDEDNFGPNLEKVFNDVQKIPYVYDDKNSHHPARDYWQSPDQTITENGGDCEDYVILFVSMIECLYQLTFDSSPPSTLIYAAGGVVTVSGTTGGHAWVFLEASKLSERARTSMKTLTIYPFSPTQIRIIIGDVGPNIKPVEVGETIYPDRNFTKQMLWIKDIKYAPVEPTWTGIPAGYYIREHYPYVKIWYFFNDEYYKHKPKFKENLLLK